MSCGRGCGSGWVTVSRQCEIWRGGTVGLWLVGTGEVHNVRGFQVGGVEGIVGRVWGGGATAGRVSNTVVGVGRMRGLGRRQGGWEDWRG